MVISKETLKEAKQFKNQMLVIGFITLPFIIGLMFLGMGYHMKQMIDEYETKIKNETDEYSTSG